MVRRIILAILVVVVILLAAAVIWAAFIREDAPEAFELSETTDAGGETTDESADTGDTGDTGGTVEGLDGTWNVSSGSEAGYRVVEDLGNVLDFEAVGRTSQVTGAITIEGTTVTAGSFEVDVASISSDDGRRDGQFQGNIMNTAEFPTATLVLTAPIELGAVPAEGTPIAVDGTGQLTLRGATNDVQFPIEAQLVGDSIELVASVDVLFSDYGIANPSNPIAQVRDEGKVEVFLKLAQG
ncbi:MAG: YceI family protein [Actinomycetota bacterium]